MVMLRLAWSWQQHIPLRVCTRSLVFEGSAVQGVNMAWRSMLWLVGKSWCKVCMLTSSFWMAWWDMGYHIGEGCNKQWIHDGDWQNDQNGNTAHHLWDSQLAKRNRYEKTCLSRGNEKAANPPRKNQESQRSWVLQYTVHRSFFESALAV